MGRNLLLVVVVVLVVVVLLKIYNWSFNLSASSVDTALKPKGVCYTCFMVAGKPLHTQTLTFFQKSGRTDGTRYTCVVLHIVLVAKRSCSAPLPSPATLFFSVADTFVTRKMRGDTQNAWRLETGSQNFHARPVLNPRYTCVALHLH